MIAFEHRSVRKFVDLVKIRILRDDFGEKKSPTRDHKPLRWAKPPAAVFSEGDLKGPSIFLKFTAESLKSGGFG